MILSKQLLLAVDIGTTNFKGALFDPDGRVVAETSCRHEVSHPHPGWAEHDAEKIWWTEFLAVCKTLLGQEGIEAKDIVSIGICSLNPAVLPVDADGNPLRPAMLYSLDTRAAQEMKDMDEILGERYSIEQNQRPMATKSTGPKMLWIKRHEPEVFEKTACFVGANTFLVKRLTGNFVSDYGCYKLAGLPFSNRAFRWDEKACEACGVKLSQLPELKFATQKAGCVTKKAAELTGLQEGTPVAVGTADFLAESLSYGTEFKNLPQICYGTCVGVNNGNDDPAILFADFDPEDVLHSVPGGSMSNGCANIDWMSSIISGIGEKKRPDSSVLEEFMNTVPAGANGITILPYFNGEKTVVDDPQAKGVIFGLRMSHTQADLYKAAQESVACSIRQVLSMNPKEPAEKKAFAMGGGTQIPMLLQTVSDVTGFSQTVLENCNGSLVGAAFIAGMACGMFTKREEINAWVKVAKTVVPRGELKEVYDKKYQTYLALYEATASLMHQ